MRFNPLSTGHALGSAWHERDSPWVSIPYLRVTHKGGRLYEYFREVVSIPYLRVTHADAFVFEVLEELRFNPLSTGHAQHLTAQFLD